MKGFKVYQLDTTTGLLAAAGRRDLYSIYLLTSSHQLQYADGEGEWNGTYLFVGKPQEAAVVNRGATRQKGYGCVFTEEFVQASGLVGSWPARTLFTGNQPGAFLLSDEQAAFLTGLFEKMLAEQQSTYCFKHELLCSYLHLVLHEALHLRQPLPKRRFRYYLHQPDSAGVPSYAWGSRRRKV